MRYINRKWKQYVIAFILIMVLLIPMATPVSALAADLYLAYQEDETGTTVTKLNAFQREKYRVTKLYLDMCQKVDLCFINAYLWKDARWTSSNPEVATVDGAGVITAKSAGVAEITLTYTRKVIGTKISASAMVYVGEENWDIWFGATGAEEKDGHYNVKKGESIDFIFSGINKIDNPDLYSMSLDSSNDDIATVSGLTATIKKTGTATVTLNIKNKVTGNIIQKSVEVKCWGVQEKLDYLLERLGAVDGNIAYFTQNQKSCTNSFVYGHGQNCSNCSNSNVVKEKWFKDIFRYVDANNFPEHTITKTGERNNLGFSCFGFACFAQWYLYADYNLEQIIGQEIKAVRFNKENMTAYVQPGDIVRVNGHSVVVYSVEADGLWVVDCNWDTSATGEKIKNCVVQKHFFSYSLSKYADKMAYINRVEKVIDKENQVGQFDIGSITETQITVLQIGDKNISVQYFQQNLYYLGYTVGSFDGEYGKQTSAAVKNLQKDLKMEQTGEVNMYLYCLVNDSMKEIQQYLTEKGYYSLEVDGIAGPGTSKAIAKLQTEWGMSATGRVTSELMQKIVEQKGTSAVQNLANYVNALRGW